MVGQRSYTFGSGGTPLGPGEGRNSDDDSSLTSSDDAQMPCEIFKCLLA